jgi:guanylate kinase
VDTFSRERHKLFIISGPSCVGKTTLVANFIQHHPEYPLRRIVTCTTRPPRPHEIDGRDYHFLSKEDFEKKIQAGEFLEFTQVYGDHFYGTLIESITPIAPVEHLLLTVDVHGTHTLLQSIPKHFPALRGYCVSLFLKPKDLETLKQRFKERSEPADEIARRIEAISTEMSYAEHYQYIILTGTMEENEDALDSIYRKETENICASPEEKLEEFH